MKLYEHTVITKPNLTKSQLEEVHNNLKSLIEKNSGKIIKLEEWGMLNFSQPIKKTKKGFYSHLKIECPGENILELEKNECINSSILRFLTVKVKKHDLESNYFTLKNPQEGLTNKTKENETK